MIVRIEPEEPDFVLQTSGTDYEYHKMSTSFSRVDQISDGIGTSAYTVADYSPRRVKLDGSCATPQKNVSNSFFEVGFYSSVVCDENCTFSDPPYLKIWQALDCDTGLTIVFNRASNEYPTIFEVQIGTQTITYEDYDKSFVYIPDSEITDKTTSGIKVTIYKWSVPFHEAQIMEIHRGALIEFMPDDIYSLDITQGIDINGEAMVLGEFNLSVSDPEGMFDIYNPNGYGNYLKPNAKILVYNAEGNGEDFSEYVLIGTFFLKEFSSQNNIATITATDIMGYVDTLTLSKEEEAYSMQMKYEKEYLETILPGIIIFEDSAWDIPMRITFKAGDSKAEILRQFTQYGVYRFFPTANGKIKAKYAVLESNVSCSIDLEQSYQFPDVKLDHKTVNGIYYTIYSYQESDNFEYITTDNPMPTPYFYDTATGKYTLRQDINYSEIINVNTMLYGETDWLTNFNDTFYPTGPGDVQWQGDLNIWLSPYGAKVFLAGTEAQIRNFYGTAGEGESIETLINVLDFELVGLFKSNFKAKTLKEISYETLVTNSEEAYSEINEFRIDNKGVVDYDTAKLLMLFQKNYYNRNYRVKCNWRGDTSIDLLDTASTISKYGKTLKGIVVENKISYNGALRQETVFATGNV